MNVHLILSFADIIATGSISALAAAAPLIPLQSLSASCFSLCERAVTISGPGVFEPPVP
jgi:hypothetical protein